MEMLMQSSDIGKLVEALSKAQALMKGASKDSTNPFFKSKYADLSSVWNACREPLTSNNLAIIQTTDEKDGSIEVITTLAHSSGQFIRGRLPIKPVKNDPQGIGSAISYARRYGLSSIVGIIQEDDDGESAMARQNGTKNKSYTTKPHNGGDSSKFLADLQSRITNADSFNALKEIWQKNEQEINKLLIPEQISVLKATWLSKRESFSPATTNKINPSNGKDQVQPHH